MKIALWFSLMIVAVVLSIVTGVTGNLTGLALGLVAVTAFSFNFMSHFVEALRDMRP
ncbi:MAG: hypothetical protein ACNJA3_29050 (plasmid) [Pseudomonas rhizophila]|uniref:hypothetical protein n=1 Tax=Pseudomonas rhizophila TaxID=2045200 RepID=UPI003F6DA2F6